MKPMGPAALAVAAALMLTSPLVWGGENAQLCQDVKTKVLPKVPAVLDQAETQLAGYYPGPAWRKDFSTKYGTLLFAAEKCSNEPGFEDVGAQAAQYAARAGRQMRIMMAGVIEEIYLDDGIDLEATADGDDNTVLSIESPLLTRPHVHQIANGKHSILKTVEGFGFTKVTFSNGIDDWSYPVKP